MVRYQMDRRSRLVSFYECNDRNNRLENSDVEQVVISVNGRLLVYPASKR